MAHFSAISYEQLPWVSQIPLDELSHRQAASIPQTYEAAIPTKIAAAQFTISSELAATAEEASHDIMRLDAYAAHALGERPIAPLASVLLRTESAASSQIEHLTVGAWQLAMAEIGLSASTNATLVAGNVTAMKAAIDLADHMDCAAILAMHRALLEHDQTANLGQWRDVPVWIGRSGLSPAGATYVPPAADRVPAAMDDLAAFLARTDLPVITHMAIAHAQFETIHPFIDGNGRTGRALMQAMARSSGIARNITVPISAGLLTDLDGYVAALTVFRQGDIQPIIDIMSLAAERAALLGRWLIDQLTAIIETWQESAKPRTGSALSSLIYLVAGQPAITSAYLIAALGISDTAARRAIDQAVAAKILTPNDDKKRNRVWLARDIVAVLDEFAIRAGRRA